MSAPAEASCFPQLLIELNVKTFEATFYNGKKLSIEYLFHSEIMGEKCLQVGLNSLAPLFGGITPPGLPQFTYISKLSNFLGLIHMDDCSHGDYASCAYRHNIEPGKEVLKALPLTGKGSMFLKAKKADLPSPDTEKSLPLDSVTKSDPPKGILREKIADSYNRKVESLSLSKPRQTTSFDDDRKSVR